MGVGRFAGPLRGVGLLAMPDAGLDMTRRVHSVIVVPLGAGVLQLRVPGMAVGVDIDSRYVAEMAVAVTL